MIKDLDRGGPERNGLSKGCRKVGLAFVRWRTRGTRKTHRQDNEAVRAPAFSASLVMNRFRGAHTAL